ncbi:MAG: 3-deoxy-7-phosphoheptulonate synthase [Clostridia bacterium]|nr:3-deoxy-7-phosphoheptulonate synthase [Clostridia bacterium]MDE7329270.1 3-deoxy-7-phosphoheptulonate synthase [Clostridia bacterium]
MFERVKKILSEEEVKEQSHLSSECQKLKNQRDETAKNIIAGKDGRLMLIIGPCSADNQDAVCDYVSRLAKVADKVKDKIFIVPRIYTNKPRTRGEGYKGILHNPDPHKNVTDILAGILAIRRMHIRAISESGLSAADEMLYPDNYHYLDDLLTYVAIGARSSENQQHRLVASGVDVPVGVKNPMNGSLGVTLNSIYAAQIPNEFKYLDYQVKTKGNPYAHAILRGSVDVYGNNHQNYHYEDIMKFSELYLAQGLSNPAVIVDTNHSNSGKNYIEQVRIAHEIIGNMNYSGAIKQIVKGLLIESYIEDGSQKITENVYGKSVTDSCLGWEKSERLIYDIADRL